MYAYVNILFIGILKRKERRNGPRSHSHASQASSIAGFKHKIWIPAKFILKAGDPSIKNIGRYGQHAICRRSTGEAGHKSKQVFSHLQRKILSVFSRPLNGSSRVQVVNHGQRLHCNAQANHCAARHGLVRDPPCPQHSARQGSRHRSHQLPGLERRSAGIQDGATIGGDRACWEQEEAELEA